MNERKPYPSDLNDEQWQIIEPLLPKRDRRGLQPKHSRREMLNAVLYLNRAGCQWRMSPHDFPPWEAVYAFWHKLVERNALIPINDALRTEIRLKEERDAEPSVVIIDSQSTQTAEKRGRLGLTRSNDVKEANDK